MNLTRAQRPRLAVALVALAAIGFITALTVSRVLGVT